MKSKVVVWYHLFTYKQDEMKNSSGLQFKTLHQKRHVFCSGQNELNLGRTGGKSSTPPLPWLRAWEIIFGNYILVFSQKTLTDLCNTFFL